jgi:type II secretory pathway component PulF
MIAVLIFNCVFIALLAAIYLLVTRRRARIYLLVDLLEALSRRGMPIQVGIRMMGKDVGGVFGTRLQEVARRVEEGASLGDAFAACPHILPPLLRGMVRLGERSGNLAAFMAELRRIYRRVEEVPYRYAAAFIYPVVITLFIGLIFAGMWWYLVPKLQAISGALMLGSKGVWTAIGWGHQALLFAALMLALHTFLGRTPFQFGLSPLRFLRRVGDWGVLVLPLLGELVRQHSIQVLAASTGLLLRAGADLPEAVRWAAAEEGNRLLRRRYEDLVRDLEEGGRMGDVCRADRWFPEDFIWFVEMGEASGSLGDCLMQAGAHFDTKARYGAEMASRSVIPIFVVLNGAFVAAVFISWTLPFLEILKRSGGW